MKGVRLHHPSFFSCTYVIELPKKYETPYDCPSCKTQHVYKSIHLRLDAQGDVIVTPGVLKTLQKVGLAGMEVVNEIPEPPEQFVGAVEVPKTEIFHPNGKSFYVPGKTKYESRDIAQKPFQPVLERLAEKIDRLQTAKKAEKRTIFDMGKNQKET